MNTDDRERLLDLLFQTHSKTLAVVEGIDLEIQVYEDGSWRIRDILGHLATWDREVARSIRAHSHRTEYAIPDFEEAVFNKEDIARQSRLTSQQVFDEWQSARQDLLTALEEMPDHLFPSEMLYPWGDERGTVSKLVEEMVDHDGEHHAEIVKALPDSPGQ